MFDDDDDDDDYIACSQNDAFRDMGQWLAAIPSTVRIVCLLSLLVNTVFLFLLVNGCRRDLLPKKRYVLLANRSIVDILMSLLTLYFLVLVQSRCPTTTMDAAHHHRDVACLTSQSNHYPLPTYLLQAGMTFNYWMLASSYCGIALLTWYAVRYPLKYRIELSVHTVLKLLCGLWLVMIAALIVGGWASHLAIFEINGMVRVMMVKFDRVDYHVVDACINIMNGSAHAGALTLALPLFGYLITIASYLIVSVLLLRKRRINRVAARHMSGVWRLGIHLGCFSISFALIAIAYLATFPAIEICKLLQHQNDDDSNSCMHAEELRAYKWFIMATTLASICWFVRMIVDPMLDLAMDTRLRDLIMQQHRRQLMTASRQSTQQRLNTNPAAASSSATYNNNAHYYSQLVTNC